jgi:hypothetical protein
VVHVCCEKPNIPLIPNFPCDKKEKGRGGFAVCSAVICHEITPHLGGEVRPLAWKDSGNAQPIPNVVPKAYGVAAMHEEMAHRFHDLLAKNAATTIWPTTLL